MVILTKRELNVASEKYPEAAADLSAWYFIAKQAAWTSFVDLRQTFPHADAVNGFVIFNIRHNRYRLITVIRYAKPKQGWPGRVFVRGVLTHKEYDNPGTWDRKYGKS